MRSTRTTLRGSPAAPRRRAVDHGRTGGGVLSPPDDPVTALELTLLEIIDLCARQPKRQRPHSAPLTRDDILFQRISDPEHRQAAILDIALRWLGEQLHARGGVKLMQATLHAVADQYSVRGGRMLSIADHVWRGIGE